MNVLKKEYGRMVGRKQMYEKYYGDEKRDEDKK
jgi:hypothetical protein